MTLLTAALFVRTPSAPDAEVFFIAPLDGETVTNPVQVIFGIKGMNVAPAWVKGDNTGHHHLIIDAELPHLNLPIPASRQYIHFTQGDTEAMINLPPGEHTLQLLMGDAEHIPHEPAVYSERITITVSGE